MQEIPVETVWSHENYPTPEAAILASANHPKQQKAVSDTALLRNQKIVNVYFDLIQCVMEFSDGGWLRVFIDNLEPEWDVSFEKPPLLPVPHLTPVELRFDAEHVYRLDPSALFIPRKHARFRRLFVNELGFYVYLFEQQILWFYVVKRRDTGEPMLVIDVDD